jgi:hypothetical protein
MSAREVTVREDINSPAVTMGALEVNVRVSGRPGYMNTPLSLQVVAVQVEFESKFETGFSLHRLKG